MKTYIYALAGGLLMLLAFSACDDLSMDSYAEKEALIFDASGGTQTMKIHVNRYSWNFVGLTGKTLSTGSTPGPIDPELIEDEFLPTGERRIHYEWATFVIAKDKRSVGVTVEKNETGKSRFLEFNTWGGKVRSPDFTVRQKP